MSNALKIKMFGLSLSVLLITGCSTNYQFVKSPEQSNQQFYKDKVYCQSGASGQNQEETQGATQSPRLVPYAECMLNLGYEQAK